MSKLIFEHSTEGRCAFSQVPKTQKYTSNIPSDLLREKTAGLPAVSELQVVRHFTKLSSKNFSIDTQFYPLGSCTMKYNPRGAHKAASLPGFLSRHPLAPDVASQGYMQCAYELQTWLQEITGMEQVSLACMAGAQGEFSGVSMIRAYHHAKGHDHKNEIIVPDAAHGTNPATAVMCGFKVVEVPTKADGDIDIDAIKSAINDNTAGIMLTNPSTLGVFERRILEISEAIHQADGLLYYDGANLNAILGQARPGDMGFDVMHINLHKTFATPHGGGGPGAGPVAAGPRLAAHLPVPMVGKNKEGYYWITEAENKQTIGRLSAFMGNAGIILRAHAYAALLGKEGLLRVSEYATLNANYLMQKLKNAGFDVTFPERRASHEFIISFKTVEKTHHVNARDIAKRLLDYGYHAPTTYFPLLVPECFLIEPTETESKEEIDGFVDALIAILKEVEETPEVVQTAPHTLPVKRLDEVKAARELDVAYQEG